VTTVAERLKTLSGMSGATVAVMLLAIGTSGNTMASRLVSYSGLPTGSVVEHLLYEHAILPAGLGGVALERLPKKKHEEDEREAVEEALSAQTISRLRDELYSATLAAEVIERAKAAARRRDEEEVLLLMLMM